MTLTIEVSPEAHARLRVKAAARNKKPEQIAQDLVEHAFSFSADREPTPFWATATQAEWEAAFREWTQGHDALHLPVLAPEAMERESFYEEVA